MEWVREPYRLRNLLRDRKLKCWESFCTESGEKSPWEVVRWAKDLFAEEAAQATLVLGEGGECPYSEDEVMKWVRGALSGTNNNSAAGTDGVGYRLIKAVWDTRLGAEVLGEVVAALRGSYIPDRWQDMRGVLIPKPGRDLIQTKNWRPPNLINCIGKLGEKVVADRIQEEGSSILHYWQYGYVRRRSAVDVLYKSVVKTTQYLKDGGSVGWAFCDVKGGFQNVWSVKVIARLEGCGPLQCWLP